MAASARAIGAEVVVIEREARLLARVASETLSRFFAQCHADHVDTDHGVSVMTGASVAAFEPCAGAVSGVRLADGRVVACDIARKLARWPTTRWRRQPVWLAATGSWSTNSAKPPIQRFTIGDCTQRLLPRYGRTLRLESVPNAIEQAKQAAAAICGDPPPRTEAPWFWSDQYDVRL